jgi:hypothetical protein
MFRFSIVSVAAVLFALLGCGGTDLIAPDDSPYFPLAVGNTWEYDGQGEDLTWTINGYAEHDCGTSLWSVSALSGDKEYTFYRRVDRDGLYEYNDT